MEINTTHLVVAIICNFVLLAIITISNIINFRGISFINNNLINIFTALEQKLEKLDYEKGVPKPKKELKKEKIEKQIQKEQEEFNKRMDDLKKELGDV